MSAAPPNAAPGARVRRRGTASGARVGIYRAIYLPWTLTDSTAAGLVEDLFRAPRATAK